MAHAAAPYTPASSSSVGTRDAESAAAARRRDMAEILENGGVSARRIVPNPHLIRGRAGHCFVAGAHGSKATGLGRE